MPSTYRPAQTIAAADAAASNAVRAADNIYTFESSPGEAGKYANPKSDAEQDGAQIGELWFAAALGTVPTSNVPTPSVTVGPNSNGTTGFTATVNFSGTYPPFFDSLFHTSKPWNLNGTAEAASDYNFVEIVMLLDNSSSMLIGASGNISATSTVSNVQAVENISVCPNSQYSTGGNGWSAYDASVPGAPALDETGFVNYIKPTSGTEGTCKDGYGNPGDPNMINGQQQYFPNGDKILNPYAPCAFACHTTSTATFTANGNTYTKDYFGLAQQAGATLRLNVLQQAAGNVITALQTNQQADGQFTVGVYLFNNDVSAVYPELVPIDWTVWRPV